MKRVFLFLLGLGLAASVAGQTYPAKPVKLVVGFAAGGPTDVIARIIAQDMSGTLGQGVIVENKTGANAMIATQDVKRAAPDGYTLLMTTLSHNVNAILLADKKPYDPIQDFAPITLVCFLPLVVVTKADAPFNSVQDLVRAAKAKPGEIAYASAGNGGSAHLAAALVEALSNTNMTHVPFRGNAPALTEVMAGRVSFMFYPMVGIAEHVAQKRLKVLASSTEILRVAVLNGAEYEFEAHVPHALAAGMTQERRGELDRFSYLEKLVLQYTDAMTRDLVVPEALYPQLDKARFLIAMRIH